MSNHTTRGWIKCMYVSFDPDPDAALKKERRRRRRLEPPRPAADTAAHLLKAAARQDTSPEKQHTTNISSLSNKCAAVSTLSPEPKQKCLSLLFASKSPDTSACLLTSPATRRREEVEVAEGERGDGCGEEGRGGGRKNQSNTAELSDHMKLWILGLSIQPLSAELCKSIQTDTKSKHTLNATIGNWSERSLPF